MADRVKTDELSISLERPTEILTQKFQEADPRRKRKFLVCVVLLLGATLSLFIFSRQINSWIEQMVTFFYASQPDSWAGQFFDSVASHSSSISADDYATKAVRLFRRVKRILLVASMLFSLAYFGLLIGNTTLPAFLHNVWKQRYKLGTYITSLVKPLQNSVYLNSLKIWFVEFYRALRNPRVLLAGVALGLATGVRAIAPWAGIIVVLYLLVKVRSKAWTTAVAYFLVAAIVTYLAWPRLWEAPVQRYVEGLGILANFANYPGRVLFNGHLYGSGELPRSYLPVLLNLQFTEPLLLGIYIGLGVLGWRLFHGRIRADLLLYIGLGFALPLFGLILLNSPLYNNFRQALFLIPAMFLLGAPALELAFSKITQNWARVILIALIALPGIYSTVKLYPYEYIYYNSLVGGLAGARDRYELDYWRISLRGAAIELNKLAPPGSTIIVTRSAGLFARYSRPDLVVDKVINSILDLNNGFDYMVQVARWQPSDLYPDIKNEVLIQRDGAVLATAKYVRNLPIPQLSDP